MTSKKPLSGPKQRRDIQAYIDETGVLHSLASKHNRIFALGVVASPNINILHKKLIRFRNQRKYYKEFKFTDVGTHNVLYYKGLIDEFFSVPNSVFNCFVYDKSTLKIRNHEKAYNSFCGSLISDMLTMLGDSHTDYVTVLADDVSTSKEDHFEREVRAKVKHKTRRNALASIIRLESHAVTEIQLCDVLIGCVAYAYKIENRLVRPDKAKLQLVKHLQKRLRTPAISTSINTKVKNGIKFRIKEIENK